MLIRRRAIAEPRIIGDIDQKLGAMTHEMPHQLREDYLESDEHGKAPQRDGHHGVHLAAAEVADALHQLIQEK